MDSSRHNLELFIKYARELCPSMSIEDLSAMFPTYMNVCSETSRREMSHFFSGHMVREEKKRDIWI